MKNGVNSPHPQILSRIFFTIAQKSFQGNILKTYQSTLNRAIFYFVFALNRRKRDRVIYSPPLNTFKGPRFFIGNLISCQEPGPPWAKFKTLEANVEILVQLFKSSLAH